MQFSFEFIFNFVYVLTTCKTKIQPTPPGPEINCIVVIMTIKNLNLTLVYREMDNEIYVTNIVDHPQRRKRETFSGASVPVREPPSSTFAPVAPGAHVLTSSDNIR